MSNHTVRAYVTENNLLSDVHTLRNIFPADDRFSSLGIHQEGVRVVSNDNVQHLPESFSKCSCNQLILGSTGE